MTSNGFERIDEALRAGGADAGFEALAEQALEEKNYPLLFEVRLMKMRHELGLPLIQVDDSAPMDAQKRAAYDKSFLDAAREVGGLFLGDGNIARAWPYFRAVGESAAVAEAIEKLDCGGEGMEPVIEIAFLERVHPYKGFQMILHQYGICRAITSFGQFPSREGREQSLRLLVRTLHGEIVERLKRVIAEEEGGAPETSSISELIASRDWMFPDGASYVDTSHLISVVRFSLDLEDAETLGLAEELTEYGSKLKGAYSERSEPPFDDFYADHRMYLRAVLGKDREAAIAHFHGKLSSGAEADDPTLPAQVLVGLLARLERFTEAIEVAQAHLADAQPSRLSCPSLTQLCYLAKDYERLRSIAREKGDLLSYTAQALASR